MKSASVKSGGHEPVVSCGVLVLCDVGEILLCHSTGSPRWDIPKGIGDEGENESEKQTALRETFEEAGLALDGDGLLDLGRFAYLRGKDLHLFAVLIDRIDLAACQCTSFFEDSRGRLRPEVDAYQWVAFESALEKTGKGLAAVLRDKLSLPAVLKRLLERRDH